MGEKPLEPTQQERGDKLVREASVEELLDELLSRSHAFVAWWYKANFKPKTDVSEDWHTRVWGIDPIVLGGVEYLRRFVKTGMKPPEIQTVDPHTGEIDIEENDDSEEEE